MCSSLEESGSRQVLVFILWVEDLRLYLGQNGGRSSCSPALATFRYFLHLPQMVQIVSSKHPDDVGNRLLAALLMHAIIFPQILGQGLQHGQVGLPQHAKGFERNLGVTPRIAQGVGPDVLVKGLNGHAIAPQNEAHAPAAYQFGIRQMSENFRDRPLSRFRSPRQLLLAQRLDQLLELLRSLSLHPQRIFAIDVAKNALHVLLRSFLHEILLQRSGTFDFDGCTWKKEAEN